MAPKISVIIPVYNVEKYLRMCLDSVINQTFKDIEIICVDDGSTDSSPDILSEYAQKDTRITILRQENKGLASARNLGLKNIKGELCYFLDSDDYISTDLFEYAIKIFDNFDIDYFCFSSKSFSEEDCPRAKKNLDSYIRSSRDGLFDLNFDIALNTNIHVWNKIFKRSVIESNGIKFIDGLLYEDIYFMWFYFFVSSKAYFETEIYHYYRLRANSIMESITENKSYDTAVPHMYNWHELFKIFSKRDDLTIEKYYNLLTLLDIYCNRTKEVIPREDKYLVEKLKQEYLEEILSIKNFVEHREYLRKRGHYNFFEKIFSVKNSWDKKRKVISILGIRIKFNNPANK